MIAELIDIMGLSRHVHQRPCELSGGQKQRAALARALVRSPRLLLMDEPLSALDRQTRKMLWRELNRIHELYPVSMVLVSHDPEEIETLTDRSIEMHNGKILEDVFDSFVALPEGFGNVATSLTEKEAVCGYKATHIGF